MVRVTAITDDGSVAVNETEQLGVEKDTLKLENLAAGIRYNVVILPIIEFDLDTIEGLRSAKVSTFTRKLFMYRN